jgi:hypothetical protein
MVINSVNLVIKKSNYMVRMVTHVPSAITEHLKGPESKLNQRSYKITMETNKETSFNNKIKFELRSENRYNKDDSVMINFTLYNLTNEGLWVLARYTPLENLKGDIFHVVCNGKKVPYEGIMVKRGPPTEKEYVYIEPGKSISREINISSAYKLPVSQECVVHFIGDKINYISGAGELSPKNAGEYPTADITGNSVSFRIDET